MLDYTTDYDPYRKVWQAYDTEGEGFLAEGCTEDEAVGELLELFHEHYAPQLAVSDVAGQADQTAPAADHQPA